MPGMQEFDWNMVSKRSSATKTPRTGRPRGDPLDVRTERFSFRLHPHLYSEITTMAREQGLTNSLWIERAAVEKVHRDLKRNDLLDVIGRYTASKPKKR